MPPPNETLDSAIEAHRLLVQSPVQVQEPLPEPSSPVLTVKEESKVYAENPPPPSLTQVIFNPQGYTPIAEQDLTDNSPADSTWGNLSLAELEQLTLPVALIDTTLATAVLSQDLKDYLRY